MARALKHEVALQQRILRGDVAHEDIRPAVSVQIRKIHAHAFEGIVAQHFRTGHRQGPFAVQQFETEMTRSGAVVEQPVGTEVIGKIDLGQQIAIQIGGPDGQRPTPRLLHR